MASLQAHFLDLFLRWQVKRRMQHITDINAARAALAGPPPPKVGPDIRITEDRLGGIPGEWITCTSARPRATLVYLHGGGYIACSPRTHRSITMAYARAGLRVFAPDYRLAPEHPFPAAVEDAVAAFRAVHAAATEPVVTGGDSAGGGLALAMMLALRDGGDALPLRAALFSPWTDLAVTGATVDSNSRRDAMFNAEMLRRAPPSYLGDADPRDPLASPVFADLRGLPPLLIHVGEREVLLDDSRRLAERARAAGVKVTISVWPAVPHVWQLAQALVPEARQSMRQAAAFLLEGTAAPIPARAAA